MLVKDVARVCHEANRALQAVQNDPAVPVAPPWDDCGEEMQRSAESGVAAVLNGATPAESHRAWVKFKRNHGWVYGEVKDEIAATHPNLVPYEDLPEEQRVKDDLFAAVVGVLT